MAAVIAAADVGMDTGRFVLLPYFMVSQPRRNVFIYHLNKSFSLIRVMLLFEQAFPLI